jgi:GAF domain-containing protein
MTARMNKEVILARAALNDVWEDVRDSRQLVEDTRRWLAAFRGLSAGALNLTSALDHAIRATGADFGNVQLLNPETGNLEIVAQRGFGGEFLEFFSAVRENQAACGTARTLGRRVVVEDIIVDPIFAESEVQGIMARAHVRAAQSTPLIETNKTFLGVISTHFRTPHFWRVRELALIDLYARDVSDFIVSNALCAAPAGSVRRAF